MGDVVFPIVMKSYGKLPTLSAQPAAVMVTVFDKETFKASVALCSRLRKEGIAAALYPQADKLGKQFKYADRCGFKGVLVLGPDELRQGKVVLKDLTAGEQVSFPIEELEKEMRDWLNKFLYI